jgi:hypothetical protein
MKPTSTHSLPAWDLFDTIPGLSEQTLRPLRDARRRLLDHPLYASVADAATLRKFMEQHVFAVWDFMSLAKRLQHDFTCCSLPWMPVYDAAKSRFINEVILQEESDEGPDGTPMSHLEMYLHAMAEVDADTAPFRKFQAFIAEGTPYQEALEKAACTTHVATFVCNTLHTAMAGTTLDVTATFLVGREDAMPEMFSRLLDAWSEQGAETPPYFSYYLQRHIELDSDTHGPAARALLCAAAGDDPEKWRAAIEAGTTAINHRIALWDGIHASLAN